MFKRQLSTIVGALLACTAAWAQAPMTNADLIKLANAGLSEDFILNSVNQQGSQLSTGVTGLIEMKNAGVSERVLREAVKKSPPPEPLNSDSVMRLARAGFSDDFVEDLMRQQPGRYSTDASTVVELKRAGVSERILSMMMKEGGGRELPSGTEIHVRLIDSIDSEKDREGQDFHASLEEPVTLGNDVVIPKGADARVRLVADKSSGKLTGRAELTLRLDEVTVDYKPVTINSTAVNEYSHSQGASTAKKAAAVGAVGAIIGALAGGGKGAAIGAGAGAGLGAGSGVFMKGQRVRVPSETVLTFTTEGSVRLP
ncbi:MAG TPA: hypothetical protein VN841_18960 [Bryobacteraceae bacterium]|nr:hypothetical protein [Bryobacteraceae bacterium]